MTKIKTHHYLLILLLLLFVVLATLILRLFPVLNYNFAFTTDQGRDMLDIRSIVVGKIPRLTGPTSSLNGLYLGPFWYYFNALPFAFGGGDPTALVIWQILWYQLAGIFLWLVLRKKQKNFALISSILFLLMPIGFHASRWFWNANAMPAFTCLFFVSLISLLQKTSPKRIIFLGLISGISLQVEAALGILFAPFALGFLLFNRQKLKNIVYFLSSFFLTLIPQLIFELRHKFIMSKVLINEIIGQTSILGDRLTFSDRLSDRIANYLRITQISNYLPASTALILFIIALLVTGLWVLKSRTRPLVNKTFYLCLAFILISFSFYLAYPQKLKSWYLEGLSVPTILIISSFLAKLINRQRPLFTLAAATILLVNLLFTIKVQASTISQTLSQPSNDPSNLSNEIKTIDWVYQKASNQGFQVFNYTPSVYDFPYQYVFWWYGTRKYGYQPQTISYLDNVPEYIQHNSLFWQKQKPLPNNYPTFLIIESDPQAPARLTNWLNNFSNLCLTEEHLFPWETTVQVRHQCSDSQ